MHNINLYNETFFGDVLEIKTKNDIQKYYLRVIYSINNLIPRWIKRGENRMRQPCNEDRAISLYFYLVSSNVNFNCL